MSSLQSTKSNRYLLIALLVAFLLALFVQMPLLRDPHLLEPDFRNFYLAFRVTDPALFPGQQLGRLELASPLYTGLLWGASLLMSPVLFSKLLIFPLLLVSVYFVFRLGEQVRDAGTGLAMSLGFVVFNLAADTELSVAGGVQRSFAIPLLLALLHFLIYRRQWWVVLVVLLTGLVYLPLLPVAALTSLMAFLLRRDDGRWRLHLRKRQLVFLIVVIMLVVILVAPVLLTTVAERAMAGVEAMREGQHLLSDPYYQEEGRLPLFNVFPIVGRGGLVVHGSLFVQVYILFMLALLVWSVRRNKVRRVPPPVRLLLYSSIAMYILSWLGIFLTSSFILYLPSRHMQFGLFLWLLIFVFMNLEETLQTLARGLQLHRNRLLYVAFPLLLLAAIAIVVSADLELPPTTASLLWPAMRVALALLTITALPLLWLAWRRGSRKSYVENLEPDLRRAWIVLGGVLLLVAPYYIRIAGPINYRPSDEDLNLLDFLGTLPKDAMIAGDPCSLDDVHYYARRNALASCWEAGHDLDVFMDELDAYYAEDAEQLLNFCRKYGVDYLVVNEETIAPSYVAEGNIAFEPANEQILQRIAGRSDFILDAIPPRERLFQRGSKFVVACATEVLEDASQ